MNNCQIIYKDIKKMYLRIKDNTIVITCPKHTSKRTIENFIRSNQDWIQKRMNEKPFTVDHSVIQILNEPYTINFIQDSKVMLVGNNIYTPNDQKYFDHFLKTYVSPYFQDRFYEISEALQIYDLNLKLAFYKSKWGSCTPSKKQICLNLNLAYAPLECIDAIIYHELAHLYVLNHSQAFYDVLLKWCPNYKEIVKQLKYIKPCKLGESK